MAQGAATEEVSAPHGLVGSLGVPLLTVMLSSV